MIRISKAIFNELISWKLEESPNEAAGYLFKDNTVFCRIITNDKSRTHFMDDEPANLLGFIQEYGKPSAIFHTHPGKAIPSYEDLKYMSTTIPIFDCVWLIMSDHYDLKAWTISFGTDEFTGKKIRSPQRGETVSPKELEVEIYE